MMDDFVTHPLPYEEIFAQMVAELEGAADPQSVIDQFCRLHPDFDRPLRERAAMIQALERMQSSPDNNWPKRLGEFQIVRHLTGGGMGDIFEAVQQSLQRRVAVKTIRRGRLSPLAQARFVREQTVLASLHQTHIVSIHTAGEEGPLQYFAMPFIEGATLQQLIQRLRELHSATPGSKTPSLAEMAASASLSQGRAKALRSPAVKRDAAAAASRSPQTARLALSPEYFRSVAQVMIDAAEALQHAHDVHILHRDLKPANLMVDTSGQCWIIDFGLAALLGGIDSPASQPIELCDGLETMTGDGLLGTPQYMAPEQWENSKVDARADVWSLGATLYELLTLRRAFDANAPFDIKAQVVAEEPVNPRKLVENVPRDLAAICLKALRKDPNQRYQTAQAFADDLRRWGRREPTTARSNLVRRMWLWASRNKGWAAAIVLAIVAIAGVVTAEIQTQERERTAAVARQQDQQLQLQLLGIHTSRKEASWRNEALGLAGKSAQIHIDDVVRNQAAAALLGIDARIGADFGSFSASSVAIDAKGNRLLAGGDVEQGKPSGARVWDLATQQNRESSRAGPGPVAFDVKGAPLQLAIDPDDPLKLTLWDVAAGRLVREFALPAEAGAKFVESDDHHPLLALSQDGAFASACAILPDGKQTVLAWSVESGELIRSVDHGVPPITALGINPEGTQIAFGDSEGQMVVCALPEGQPEVLRAAGRSRVHCLGFGRAPAARDMALGKYRLLAVGDEGGSVVVWNLDRGIPQAYCHGSHYNVDAVAFSPDGMTLASAGRGPTHLWDTATGRLLVALEHKDFMTGLAFTPDGRHLAASSENAFGGEGGVHVWDLETGRGMQTLRGLVEPVAQVCISPSVDRIAALSHGWQIGVWDARTGFLESVLNVPSGISADNAALEFSADGRQLAYAAGYDARLWDLATGEERQWKLERGLRDSMAFAAGEKSLLLFRAERANGLAVCRMRDLLGPDPEAPLWEDKHFNNRVLDASTSRDGAYVVVRGSRGPSGAQRSVKLFQATTGKELWSMSAPSAQEDISFAIDPLGKQLAISTEAAGGGDLLELPSCRLIDRLGQFSNSLSPGAAYVSANGQPNGIALFRRHDKSSVVTLGVNTRAMSVQSQFSADGKLLAWGNDDGTVYVCDIQEVQRQLANLGLGW